jgi:AcrR family transcriptional regulator
MPAALSRAEKATVRRRLLETAARMFVERGRDGLTMRKLAAEFGYSTMALYRWFKNKEEILVALRTDGFNRMGDALEAAYAIPGSARKRHRRVIAAYYQFAKRNPNFYRALFDSAFTPSAAPPPALLKARARLAIPMKAHSELILEEKLDVDIRIFADQMWASLHGAILLDEVGLFGLDVLTVHEATIDALIDRYRSRESSGSP